MSEKNGVLVFSASLKKSIVVSIADDIKVLVKIEDNRLKIVIEAPKDKSVRKLKDLELHLQNKS